MMLFLIENSSKTWLENSNKARTKNKNNNKNLEHFKATRHEAEHDVVAEGIINSAIHHQTWAKKTKHQYGNQLF